MNSSLASINWINKLKLIFKFYSPGSDIFGKMFESQETSEPYAKFSLRQ